MDPGSRSPIVFQGRSLGRDDSLRDVLGRCVLRERRALFGLLWRAFLPALRL
jgi:hypothetical protein